MTPAFGFVGSLVLLTQMFMGNKGEYGGNYYGHHQKGQTLDDLLKRWDSETPDWLKSKERPEAIIYLPNTPGDYFPQYEYHGRRPEPNPNWRPGFTWPNPSDETASQFRPPPVPVTPSPSITPAANPPNPRSSRQVPANFRECLQSCPVTAEHNPVCGTDNVTYTNPGRLSCAQQCGLDVNIRKRVSCSVPDGIDEGNMAQRPPVVNGIAPPGNSGQSVIWPREVLECVTECPSKGPISPVCGTDGITYANSEHLLCAQMCGADVRAKQLSACSATDNIQNNFGTVNPGFPQSPQNNQFVPPNNARNPGNNLRPIPPVTPESYTVPPHLRSCIRSCPVTLDSNPVCGTNGVLYNNPSQMTCARICGIDVHPQPLSVCQPTATSSLLISTSTTTEPPTTTSKLDCVAACPITSVENPVCGTNGVTYKNPTHLQCIKRCGVDIDVKSFSPCQTAVQIPTSTSAPVVLTTTPKATTNKPVTVTITTTQAPTVTVQTTNSSTLKSTIPNHILQGIFTTKQPVEATSESTIDDQFIRINDD